MTKENVKKLIERIRQLGSQVDLEGILASVLAEIADGAVPTEVEDIKAIDGAVLDALKCGDKVVKVTGKQKHVYVVSYKGDGEGEGITLTYVDATLVETVSYDYTSEGWAYNSTDKTTLTPDA